jgi:hypothetical protein
VLWKTPLAVLTYTSPAAVGCAAMSRMAVAAPRLPAALAKEVPVLVET